MAPKKGKRSKPKALTSNPVPSTAPKDVDGSQGIENSTEEDLTTTATEPSASGATTKKQRRNQRKAALATQGTLTKPLNVDGNSLEPAKDGPAKPDETASDLKINAFLNPNATRLPRQDILEVFPTESAWRETYTGAMICSVNVRNGVMANILLHSCIKNQVLKAVVYHGELILQNNWPFSHFPAAVKHNQFDWLHWIANLKDSIPAALVYINWTVLLDREYKSVEPMWDRFWKLHHKLEEAKKRTDITPSASLLTELTEIEEKMAVHNRRRCFLQRAISAMKPSAIQVYMPPPDWINWEDMTHVVLQAAAAQGGEVESDSESEGGELDKGYESGHVSELGDTENEEEGPPCNSLEPMVYA